MLVPKAVRVTLDSRADAEMIAVRQENYKLIL